jgi:hypothetical protein
MKRQNDGRHFAPMFHSLQQNKKGVLFAGEKDVIDREQRSTQRGNCEHIHARHHVNCMESR